MAIAGSGVNAMQMWIEGSRLHETKSSCAGSLAVEDVEAAVDRLLAGEKLYVLLYGMTVPNVRSMVNEKLGIVNGGMRMLPGLEPLTKCNKGVWSDSKIAAWAASGGVTPFDESCINPASLDLRLGNQIREPHKIWNNPASGILERLIRDGSVEQMPKWSEPTEFEFFWLMPGKFVLCHSLELVRIPVNVASILVLKSSQGRLGLNHSHSGWGDPGFGLPKTDGENSGASWTFEIQNVAPWPIKLAAGQRLIQQVFFDMSDAPAVDYRYTGHYVYQTGPTVAVQP